MSSSAPEGVVDGASASEADIAAALGVGQDAGNPPPETPPDAQDGDGDVDEVEFEDLPEKWRTEIADLRRQKRAYQAATQKAAQQARKAAAPKPPAEEDLTAAQQRGREEARLEYGMELASAKVEAALKGIVPDSQIEDVIEDLNLARYVGEDGKPDAEAIASLADKYKTLVGIRKRSTQVNHGKQGSTPTQKSTGEQFAEALAPFM